MLPSRAVLTFISLGASLSMQRSQFVTPLGWLSKQCPLSMVLNSSRFIHGLPYRFVVRCSPFFTFRPSLYCRCRLVITFSSALFIPLSICFHLLHPILSSPSVCRLVLLLSNRHYQIFCLFFIPFFIVVAPGSHHFLFFSAMVAMIYLLMTVLFILETPIGEHHLFAYIFGYMVVALRLWPCVCLPFCRFVLIVAY